MSTTSPRRCGRRWRRPAGCRPERPLGDPLNTVDLHVETLDLGEAAMARNMRLIDDDERIRAAKFRFVEDARRFVARRARLREILAGYVGVAPERLDFAHGSHGKPVLRGGALQFSLSHSHGLMMLAVADVDVGCDIERIDPGLEWAPLADRLFAPAERDALRRLPDAEACRGFYDCWSRKEAYVKAIGLGLSQALDSFEVSVGREARLLAQDGWAIADAPPRDGFAGAVVARAAAVRLDVRHR